MNVTTYQFDDDQYVAYVETKSGHRYFTFYTHFVTKEEVKEDFKNDRSSFEHVN